MTVHYEDHGVTLHHGDCLEVLPEIPDGSIDAVVTDPPYGLRFMGKSWDGADIQTATATRRRQAAMPDDGRSGANGGYRSPSTEAGRYDLSANAAFGHWCQLWAAECLRILKPGGFLLSFGGSRTWHRLAVAVEDAGFEIRDSIAWLYGSGFPKSLDVSKAITGHQMGHGSNSGAIRRATMGAAYVESGRRGNRDGAGRRDTGLNDHELELTPDGDRWRGWGTSLKPAFEPIVVARKPLQGTVAANVLEHGTGALNIDRCRIDTNGETWGGNEANAHTDYSGKVYGQFGKQYAKPSNPAGRWPANVILDESQAAALDEQSGDRPGMSRGVLNRGATTGRSIGGDSAYGTADPQSTVAGYGDSGGASRYFYTAKADQSERITHKGITHPTVKPLDLMRWLVRLVTPPGGTILEPFAGSGTTIEAALLEGFQIIGIEREADYLPLITQRINRRRNPVAYLDQAGEDLGLFASDGGAA